VTKQLRKPVAYISERVSSILTTLTDPADTLKYLQHSTHDDSVANALVFLNPTNFTYYDVPFASSLFLELHYDMQCV